MDIPGRRVSDSSSSQLEQQDVESSLKVYRQVFSLCDKDRNGFITKEELAQICEQASNGCVVNGILDNVMQCLKPNHEGHISFEEFKSGFESFQRVHDVESPSALATSTPSKPVQGSNGAEEVFESEPVVDETEGAWTDVADRLDPLGNLAGTGVKEMWQDLYTKDPALLENFESFLCEVVSELKQSDTERSTLENHIRKITEQHSREVSEMDHLLQEELQQAKVNQEQNNASQTSRLSNHYTSLLAQREAVIGEMITQESDLKQALEHKAMAESQLREDRNILHSENQGLRDQLNTSQQSTPQHPSGDGVESESEASLLMHALDPEATLPVMSRLMPTPPNLLDSEGSGYSLVHSQTEVGAGAVVEPGQPRLDQELATAVQERINPVPESTFRLNVIQEDLEEDDVKYYPQRGISAETTEVGGAIRHGQLKLDGGGSDIRASNECPPCSEGPSTPTTPSKSVASVTVSHASVQNGGRDLDLSLTVSGVMSRREDLPHPSPHSINRVFKVVFLGDSGVGKTSLIACLAEGQFKSNVRSTVGLDYSIKTLKVGEEKVMFQLWDTAGQERFNSALTPVYFRRADAFVIVYDVADRLSFKATKKWISVLKAALREQPPVVMLVGNKSDKNDDRCVSIEEGRRLAVELQAMFSEMSALSGDNVLHAHSTLAHLLLAREDADLRELKNRSMAAGQEQTSRCSC